MHDFAYASRMQQCNTLYLTEVLFSSLNTHPWLIIETLVALDPLNIKIYYLSRDDDSRDDIHTKMHSAPAA